MSNIGNFPQAAIVTSLDIDNAQAKAMLPLYKIETGWIPVASHLLQQTQVVIEDLQLDSLTVAGGSAAKITYGSLQVGDEVAVIFLGGDLNQGRVIARFD